MILTSFFYPIEKNTSRTTTTYYNTYYSVITSIITARYTSYTTTYNTATPFTWWASALDGPGPSYVWRQLTSSGAAYYGYPYGTIQIEWDGVYILPYSSNIRNVVSYTSGIYTYYRIVDYYFVPRLGVEGYSELYKLKRVHATSRTTVKSTSFYTYWGTSGNVTTSRQTTTSFSVGFYVK